MSRLKLQPVRPRQGIDLLAFPEIPLLLTTARLQLEFRWPVPDELKDLLNTRNFGRANEKAAYEKQVEYLSGIAAMFGQDKGPKVRQTKPRKHGAGTLQTRFEWRNWEPFATRPELPQFSVNVFFDFVKKATATIRDPVEGLRLTIETQIQDTKTADVFLTYLMIHAFHYLVEADMKPPGLQELIENQFRTGIWQGSWKNLKEQEYGNDILSPWPWDEGGLYARDRDDNDRVVSLRLKSLSFGCNLGRPIVLDRKLTRDMAQIAKVLKSADKEGTGIVIIHDPITNVQVHLYGSGRIAYNFINKPDELVATVRWINSILVTLSHNWASAAFTVE